MNKVVEKCTTENSGPKVTRWNCAGPENTDYRCVDNNMSQNRQNDVVHLQQHSFIAIKYTKNKTSNTYHYDAISLLTLCFNSTILSSPTQLNSHQKVSKHTLSQQQ